MQNKTIILFLTALLAIGPLSAQNESDTTTASGLREKGRKAEKMGLTELAENYYRRALQTPEGDPSGTTQQWLGILMEQKEYYQEAVELLSQSNSSEAMAHQAYCLIQMRLIDSASHCAARAIEQDTTSSLAMTMMAYVETERDHHINAISWANRALKADPKSAQGENVMGYIQYRKGNHAEAMRHFKKAIQLDSTMANAYYNLGTLYCIRNSQDMAIKLLKQGLRRNPRNIRLYTIRQPPHPHHQPHRNPLLRTRPFRKSHRLPPPCSEHPPQRCCSLQIHRQSLHRLGQIRQSHPELHSLNQHLHHRPGNLHVPCRVVRQTEERRTQATIGLPQSRPSGSERSTSLACKTGTDLVAHTPSPTKKSVYVKKKVLLCKSVQHRQYIIYNNGMTNR